MAEPHVALVTLRQVVELADLVRPAIPLEDGHVLARRHAEGAVDTGVDLHHDVHDVVVLGPDVGGGRDGILWDVKEEAPDERVGPIHVLDVPGVDPLVLDHVGPALEQLFHPLLGDLVVQEQLDAVLVGIVREQAVAGVAGAQAVLPVRHGGDHVDDPLARFPRAVHVDVTGDATGLDVLAEPVGGQRHSQAARLPVDGGNLAHAAQLAVARHNVVLEGSASVGWFTISSVHSAPLVSSMSFLKFSMSGAETQSRPHSDRSSSLGVKEKPEASSSSNR